MERVTIFFTAKVTETYIANMFTILLLACCVAGEWVEIAQNHYRKEPSRRVTLNNQDSSANKIYANYSITERPWNRGVVTKIPNPGNIKRVQILNEPKNQFSSPNLHEDHLAEYFDLNAKKQLESFGSVRAPNIKRMGNVGTINNEKDRDATRRFNNPDELLGNGVNSNMKIDMRLIPTRHFNKLDKEINRITHSSTVDEARKRTEEKELQDLHTLSEDIESKNTAKFQENINFKKSTKLHTSESPDLEKNLQFNPREKQKETVNKENGIITKTNPISSVGNLSPKDLTAKPTITMNKQNKRQNIPTQNTDKVNEIHTRIHHKEEEEVKEENIKTNIKTKSRQRIDNKMNTDQESFETEDSLSHSESKANPVEVIWKLMKVVTDNISRNTRRSLRSKVKYLEGLQHTILSNIEERIEQAWPDEAGGAARSKRSARGHVEFPSSESALMTISFLTFAVFLIKLVLQVIHTYKNKTMMVTPAVVAAVGRAAAALTKRPENSI